MKLLILMLAIAGIAQGSQFYGAEVYSKEKVLYGKFEIRMKSDSASGTLSTFFLYDDQSWQGDQFPWGEIDIEVLQKERNLVQTNIITGSISKKVMSEEDHRPNYNLDDGFHTYTLIWTPEEVSWYLNHNLIRRTTGKQVNELRNTFMSYRMNHWAASYVDWVGKFDSSALPVTQVVDWVRYYEYIPSSRKGEKPTFKFAWSDEFNYFDNKRWGKGDWTFEGNLITFAPENAYVNNGYLYLRLGTKK